MPLSFSYSTTQADYAHFDQARINYLTAGDVNRNRQFSEQVYSMIFIMVFLVAVAVLAAAVQVSFSIFSFALGIVFYISMTRYKVRQIRNKFTPGPDCSLFGEHEMHLDKKSLTVRTQMSSFTTAWQTVTAVQENDSYFFIFLDSLHGFYIPKRELTSESLAVDIRTFLADMVQA
ncbi:MAG: YcxB family protein [Gammaproteobacteria bacterium]